MKSPAIISSALFCCFSIISCSNIEDLQNLKNSVINTFEASLNPVAGTGSTASGEAVLLYDDATRKFTVTVSFTGLTESSARIYGPDQAMVFELSSITSLLKSPIIYTSPKLTDSQIEELMSNRYYINLHTKAFPNGELSGTLIKKKSYGISSN